LREAHGAAGTAVVVKKVPAARPELDDGVLRARAEAAVALEAIPAGQATPRFVKGFVLGQPADDFGEIVHPFLGGPLGLVAPGKVPEVPQMEPAERCQVVLVGLGR
jgi:hypothetical protein